MTRILNVGCGQAIDRSPGVVNLDAFPYPGVNVVHDLASTPWPFDDGTFDEVRAIQVYEHLDGKGCIAFMCEAWRVLRPDGKLTITTPHWQSENSYTDPTHVQHCTLNSWGYWSAGHHLQAQFGPVFGSPPAVFSRATVTQEGAAGEDIRAVLVK